MNSRSFRKLVIWGHKAPPGGEGSWVWYLPGNLRATWKHWGVWDGTWGYGRGAEIQRKLPGKCWRVQSCGRKGTMAHFFILYLLTDFPFVLLLFPLLPPLLSLSSSSSISFILPPILLSSLHLPCLCFPYSAPLTASAPSEQEFAAIYVSAMYLVKFPFLDYPGNWPLHIVLFL